MTWENKEFQRDTLFRGVWAEPVLKVAKRYGISDVGLKKICKKLEVPTPPLGYWAKLEAGKEPRVNPHITNYKGRAVYVRNVQIDKSEPERNKRARKLLDENRPDPWPDVRVPEALDGCHVSVTRTASALGSKSTDPKKVVSASSERKFDVTASIEQRDLALRSLQGCGATRLASGAEFQQGTKAGERPHFLVLGRTIDVRIEQLYDSTLHPADGEESCGTAAIRMAQAGPARLYPE